MTTETHPTADTQPTPEGAPAPARDLMLGFVIKCAVGLTLVGMLGSVLAQPENGALALSFGLGAALAIGNFWLSRRIVARMVSQPGSGGGTAGMLVAKMLGFFGLVYVSFKALPVDVMGFTGGLMVVVLSIVLGNAFGPKARAENQNG